MKVTKTLYLFEDAYGSHSVFNSDMSGQRCFEKYVLICTQDMTFDIPDDINVVALKVAAIDRQIERTQDDFSLALRRLKSEKAKLLCLENGVAA